VVRTVQVAVNLFTSKTHEKNITLQSDLPEAPVEATLDEAALHRILTNLLSNAVKFTGEGGRIDVRLDPQPTHLVLEIEDTGIGIDEGFVDQLFDAFQQESSGDARAFEGSGLGLTITHRLVELMGGAITVATEKGRGTQFTVRLPYRIEP
jgi:signal transduction histidine kinase